MKSFVTWLVALSFIVGGGLFAMQHINNLRTEYDYKLALSELKGAFETQSMGLQHLGPEEYRKELGVHLTRYFSQLRKLGKAYPEEQDIERELKKGEKLLAKGHLTGSKKQTRDEVVNRTLDVFKRLRSGQYRPLYTHVDRGFRFDIYDIRAVENGHAVRVSYVHWGAFGPVEYKMIEGTYTADQQAGKAAQVSQIVGDNQPPALQIKPERWVKEFIPGVEIGYYDFPKAPTAAKSIQLSFDYSIRTVGGSAIAANIVFPEIPLSSEWKLSTGEDWQGQERFASDEELEAAGVKPQVKMNLK